MASQNTGFWLLLYDWQTLIAGFLALIAGCLAAWTAFTAGQTQVAAAKEQTRAVERQNVLLTRENQRRLARDVLISARLLLGVLTGIEEDTAALSEALEQQNFFGPNATISLSDHRSIRKPPLSVVWDKLGLCKAETVRMYLSLDAELERFAASVVLNVHETKNDLQKLKLITRFLRDELEREASECEAVLHRTQDAPLSL